MFLTCALLRLAMQPMRACCDCVACCVLRGLGLQLFQGFEDFAMQHARMLEAKLEAEAAQREEQADLPPDYDDLGLTPGCRDVQEQMYDQADSVDELQASIAAMLDAL